MYGPFNSLMDEFKTGIRRLRIGGYLGRIGYSKSVKWQNDLEPVTFVCNAHCKCF